MSPRKRHTYRLSNYTNIYLGGGGGSRGSCTTFRFLCMCIYIWVYICVYIHRYTYINTYVCVCIFTHTYVHIYMYVYLYVYMYICIYFYIYVCMYICIYIYKNLSLHVPGLPWRAPFQLVLLHECGHLNCIFEPTLLGHLHAFLEEAGIDR